MLKTIRFDTFPLLMATTLGVIAQPALAAPNAGQLLNEQQQKQEIPAMQALPEQQEQAPVVEMKDEQGPKVLVRDFTFSGNEGIVPTAQLQAQVAPYIGKKLGFTQLQAVADTVTSYLKQKGWPLAHAYLPKQDVTDGHIHISIMQGRIGKEGAIVRSPNVRLSQDMLKDTVDGALPDNRSPSQEDLERGVLLINDMPGMSAKATLEKGDEPGTTKLVVDTTEGPLVKAAMTADNYGNRYTGNWEVMPTISINDALGIGDQLTLGGTETYSGGIDLGQIGYSLPVGTSGLRLGVNYSYLSYTLDDSKAGVTGDGTAQNAGVTLSYPFIRTRATSAWVGTGYTYKKLIDNVSDIKTSDRNIDEADLNLTVTHNDAFGGGGSTTAIVAVTAGDLDRSGELTDLSSDSATAHSNGSFSKMTYSLVRLQHLSDDFSLFGAVRGQQAAKNLDSSEKFILGGPVGIRAFPVGEASGDEGWLTNVELRYDVPGELPVGKLQLITFVDAGGVTLNRDNWPGGVATFKGENNYDLAGIGLGANVNINDAYFVRTSWAVALGDNPGRTNTGMNADGRSSNQQFWLQVAANF